ncbi:MAG: pantoate--beta-alanine ligase [Proteobacteria bacterium]|nr:MAG: pantoate--beta-alanine ligase [Pseudomonadota bacterium]
MKNGAAKAPQLFTKLDEWRKVRSTLSGKTIGFVPTMGALHAGHGSLLENARRENDIVVLSVYVNPTQFNDPKDLEKYPKTLDRDVELAAKAGVDYVLSPNYAQMYPDHYRYKLTENDLSTKLCGAHRPGHFDGVLTVVMKLFNLVRADHAYFGEKDFQQLELIRGMSEAFFLQTKVVGCPTVREEDGLAMSSRNVNLDSASRALAPTFAKALRSEKTTDAATERLSKEGFIVEYVEDINHRRYGAVRLGGVRLIDNVEVGGTDEQTL